jgi:hypothetical protein
MSGVSDTDTDTDTGCLLVPLVSVLVNFYCDRLSETTCVPTILEGLVALTGFPHISGANAVLVAKRLDWVILDVCSATESARTKQDVFLSIIESSNVSTYSATLKLQGTRLTMSSKIWWITTLKVKCATNKRMGMY